jgi:hypothetical protein
MTAKARIGAAVAGAVLLVGCGGNDSGNTVSVSSMTVSATEPTVPADTELTLGETSAGETTAAQTAAPESAVAVSAGERLQALLPALEEMPAGWSLIPPDAPDEKGTGCMDLAFGTLETLFGSDASAKVLFSQTQFGPFLLFAATDVANVGNLNALADQVAACNGTTDSNGTTWSILPLSFPKQGDETFAIRADGTGQLLPVTNVMVFVKEGDIALTAQGVSIGGATTDAALMESILRRMVDRAS